ncbi:type II toxin-antitoxin system death-on-curing family toxin [Sphingomonas sp. Root1294]|uniref:type II toxin-antitoxin system death-on-curing family toxin n=2 Tax=Sphingomonas TaxID=13687 RepID=UPI0006FB545C|nr:type II toxin-antitoxin system death-on-curing family toxin [Sphingomonas sp. Root1294]KQX18109.1 death-on-curing protein [Sphingomonas sp. Root1294]KQY72664.1 death-on-curing protein [Sphingomonas sp. Root50]KRB87709.1 death-on-curing protein [Sphingomonas sp. Root720]
MTAWKWVAMSVVHALHDRQLAEHGGLAGVRDQGALESALARPLNLAAYGKPDAAALAAAYAFGFARNHGFADGNKRSAWIVARLFLMANGIELVFDKAEALNMVVDLSAGRLAEEQVASWFRQRIVPT